jgi:flagellar hook protein FlgE
MSILGALFTGVSGLSAESQAMGIISDNIANANTTAYKDTEAQFSTLVTQIPTNTLYQPGGVIVHPSTMIDQQGLLQATTSSTDLALSGGGFFVVNNTAADTGAFSFTRAGAFAIDANGNLKNSAGFFLQGQKLTAAQSAAIAAGNNSQLTVTTLNSLATVNVNGVSGTAKATQNVTLAANLPATDTAASAPHAMTVPVFDSQGTEHNLTLTFSATAVANQWTVAAAVPGATVTIAAGDNLVNFNPDGTLAASSTFNTAGAVQITAFATGGAAVPQALNVNIGTAGQSNGLTQFGGPFAVTNVNQDGLQLGNFTGITISPAGIVTANFDNGLSKAIYMVPVATFRDPDGLAPQTGNVYLQTASSGPFLLQQAGVGAAGQIAPSSLEGSTVDIATQFANLIITQRAYEADAKIMTTADQMLQTLIQAKQ